MALVVSLRCGLSGRQPFGVVPYERMRAWKRDPDCAPGEHVNVQITQSLLAGSHRVDEPVVAAEKDKAIHDHR